MDEWSDDGCVRVNCGGEIHYHHNGRRCSGENTNTNNGEYPTKTQMIAKGNWQRDNNKMNPIPVFWRGNADLCQSEFEWEPPVAPGETRSSVGKDTVKQRSRNEWFCDENWKFVNRDNGEHWQLRMVLLPVEGVWIKLERSIQLWLLQVKKTQFFTTNWKTQVVLRIVTGERHNQIIRGCGPLMLYLFIHRSQLVCQAFSLYFLLSISGNLVL